MAPGETPAKLRLRRLRIDRFRSVAPGTELAFSPGWNVLLGRNATGKTTLLELSGMVLRGDFSALAKESFALSYELETPGGGLDVSIDSTPGRDPLMTRVGGPDPEVAPRAEFRA